MEDKLEQTPLRNVLPPTKGERGLEKETEPVCADLPGYLRVEEGVLPCFIIANSYSTLGPAIRTFTLLPQRTGHQTSQNIT